MREMIKSGASRADIIKEPNRYMAIIHMFGKYYLYLKPG